MAKLNDLGLGKEIVGAATDDFDAIPEQMGSFQDPPQPGPFRFKLPVQMGDIWDKAEKSGKNAGPRIQAKFDGTAPLAIVQSQGGVYNGEPFETRISNVERKRGKDENAPEASDMDYLLRDGFGLERKPKTNLEYAQELIKHAGQEFSADIEWSWRCRDDKAIRVETETGGTEEVAGQMGCGQRYYQKDVAKVLSNPDDPASTHVFPLRITCGGKDGQPCGASLRAYANLVRFRK